MIIALALPLMFGYLAGMTPPPQEVHTKDQTVNNHSLCSCVAFAIAQGGNIPLIDADKIAPATSTPYVGAVAVFFYEKSGLGHVALVTAVGDGWFSILESNYAPCQITERTLNLDYLPLRGFL